MTTTQAIHQIRQSWRVLSLDEPIRNADGAEATRGELMPSDEPSPEDRAGLADRCRQIESAISKLAPKQRAVIVGRYWRDMTLEQVGKALGCSHQAAGQIERGALDRLRVMLR